MEKWEGVQAEVRGLRRENREAHSTIFEKLDSQNGRIKLVELWRARIEGMGAMLGILAAVIGGAAGIVAALITLAIKRG